MQLFLNFHLLLLLPITASIPAPSPQQPQGPSPQLTINEPPLPIEALVHAGAPGPNSCRGTVLTRLTLPGPGRAHAAPTCHDLPRAAQCATFRAAQADGCEARLFARAGCAVYVNTAVFAPDAVATGGLWRSIEVRCGVEGVVPPSLSLPGLRGQLPAPGAGRGDDGGVSVGRTDVWNDSAGVSSSVVPSDLALATELAPMSVELG